MEFVVDEYNKDVGRGEPFRFLIRATNLGNGPSMVTTSVERSGHDRCGDSVHVDPVADASIAGNDADSPGATDIVVSGTSAVTSCLAALDVTLLTRSSNSTWPDLETDAQRIRLTLAVDSQAVPSAPVLWTVAGLVFVGLGARASSRKTQGTRPPLP